MKHLFLMPICLMFLSGCMGDKNPPQDLVSMTNEAVKSHEDIEIDIKTTPQKK